MRQFLIPLVALLAISGCKELSTAEVVGRVVEGGLVASQGLFISDEDEIKLGLETTAKVLSQMPEYPNPGVRDYVNEIGQRLAGLSERPTLKYEFRVLQSNEINAFAAPGGFIFVTTGALQLMKNEAQLAGVLGHEVGHVAKRHSVNSIRQAMIAQGVAVAVLGKDQSEIMKAGANIAANLILKGFDRGAELESDRMGAAYAYKAGYDPRELGSFLNALRQTSGDIPPYLVATSDHPRTDDRLNKLSEYMTAEGMKLDSLKLGESEYQAKVTAVIGGAPVPTPSATPAP